MMKAVRFHGQRDIRVDDVEIVPCGRGQVKVKPAFAGICGSDLHEYLGGASLIPTSPHPITNEKAPLTLGHEFSGTIEELGEDVRDIKVGARVTVQPIIYDGTCNACKEGYINCCDKNGFVSLSGWGGGLSEHVIVPRKAVYEIPDNVSFDVAALVEPLAVAWHAVNISPFKKGDSVLILGGGPIELAVMQMLRAKGAGKMLVSEVASRRREFTRQFGAHHVLNPLQDDIVARVRELCDSAGVNLAFNAAGVQAVQAIRARGTLVNIAIWEKRATITPNWFCFRERRYMGVATYQDGDFQDVIDSIASGKLKPAPMITGKVRMDEVVEQGFNALVNDKDYHIKVLINIGLGVSRD